MAAFGLAEEKIEALMAHTARETRQEEVEVFAWLATPLRWFLAMASQWRRDPEGRATGLDYASADATARLAGLSPEPEDFAHLQILEQAMLARLRDRRSGPRRIGGRA